MAFPVGYVNPHGYYQGVWEVSGIYLPQLMAYEGAQRFFCAEPLTSRSIKILPSCHTLESFKQKHDVTIALCNFPSGQRFFSLSEALSLRHELARFDRNKQMGILKECMKRFHLPFPQELKTPHIHKFSFDFDGMSRKAAVIFLLFRGYESKYALLTAEAIEKAFAYAHACKGGEIEQEDLEESPFVHYEVENPSPLLMRWAPRVGGDVELFSIDEVVRVRRRLVGLTQDLNQQLCASVMEGVIKVPNIEGITDDQGDFLSPSLPSQIHFLMQQNSQGALVVRSEEDVCAVFEGYAGMYYVGNGQYDALWEEQEGCA